MAAETLSAKPVGAVLTELADADPHRPCITCDGVTITRIELEQQANMLAREYEALGVTEGSYVTIALSNSIEFFVVCFAVWKLGAVPQPVSPQLPFRERDAIIELADPSLIVGVSPGTHGGRRCLPTGFQPDAARSAAPILPVRISPAWKAPTSGGSTGRPKLIVAGIPAVWLPESERRWRMRPDSVQLVPGPLYHNAPLSFALAGLYSGGHLIVIPKFDPVAALEAIQTYRVEWVSFVPTMMRRISRVLEECPATFDLSSLQTVWHMAASCPERLKEAWIELVGPENLFELYGATETISYTTITGTEWLEHRGSVGRPVFGAMKVLGPDGDELPAGELGEIFMRRPDGVPATYRYIGAEQRERDGWESLGDLGWMDKDGYVYIADRRTDMIVSGGANVYPAEVEAALSEHPEVESCLVVGLPDEDLGSRVHAVVQTATPVAEDELCRFLAERLVRYKVPRSFRFVGEPLRDDMGKARRSAVRDREIDIARATAGPSA